MTHRPFPGLLRFVAGAIMLAGIAATVHAQDRPRIDIVVTGRVIDVSSGGADPVACCDVEVRLHPADPLRGDRIAIGHTHSDGTYSIPVTCPYASTMSIEVTARALCCDGMAGPITIVGCLDATGMPWSIDLGDIECIDSPIRAKSLLTGFVNCRRGPFLEPVEDCSLLIRDVAGAPVATARTDGRGRWEACVPCDPTAPLPYTMTAECCGESQDFIVPPGCASSPVPTLTCGTCPVPPCPNRTEVEIRGQLVCEDAAGVIQPVPDCRVSVVPQGPDTNGDGLGDDCAPGTWVQIITGIDGRYVACVPCPVDGDCGSVTWDVFTWALCCFANPTTTVVGCPPIVDQGQVLCASGCPPPARPCGSDGTELRGRLTCVDGAGIRRAVPGCAISITSAACAGLPPVTAITAAGGSWSACWPACRGCDVVTVQALCCGEIETVSVAGCPSRAVVDLRCTDCALTRPCPADPAGIEATQVAGLLVCSQGGLATPIAGCAIRISAYVTGEPDPVAEVAAITDGDGRYVACLPCGDPSRPPPDHVVAGAACCDAESSTPIAACPAAATLETIACAACSPCPTGSTRVQGKVICRGGGPVSGCAVVVIVDACSGPLVLEMTTDAQGRYRACVPCPCPGGAIRVEATCCRSARTLVPTTCGPVTPIPTLFCGNPCPG